jgi:branched-chain amino acid transport system substrate-binding protein
VIALLVLSAPSSGTEARPSGGSATIYSSLPLTGASRPQTQAIVRGARLALEERGGVAGAHAIRYVSLDDATRAAGSWTPGRAQRNARRAARDASAIGYIGAFNSGASAVSMPLLSAAGIPQISPSNTAIGLTRGGPGAQPGEPGKYYTRGLRHYFRIAPTDRVQAGALAVAMRDAGCRRVASLTDGELYGAGVGTWMRQYAKGLGLRVVVTDVVRRGTAGGRRLVRRVRRSRPDCVVYTGITANGAVRLFTVLARRLPTARFFGSDGIAESGFVDPRAGGVAPRVGGRMVLTAGTLAPSAYPPAGAAFFARYAARYGEPNPDPYSIYGYEAMQLLLDAVTAVGTDRSMVIGWLRSVESRPSVLGDYGFDRFGDTTTRTYGLYRIDGGQLVYAGAVQAPQ